ncbi:MAG: UvrD-helicase domain-containing protein, partial [Solirubrobacterales bacterium]|nr:UvrD-helicase domain-containing protein [Solirubrobacterales bacterium]
MPEAMLEADTDAPTFTEEQLAAIERREGDLLLDAGAGSGKTSVLVERFVRSVLEDGLEVGEILTITFTEKAARELRERIAKSLHADLEGAWISTIHGFCARLLRTYAVEADVDPAFQVLNELPQARLRRAAFASASASFR